MITEQSTPTIQPQIKTSPYQNPMAMFGGSIEKLTNPDHELKKLEITFRGYKMDGDKLIKIGDPMMNDVGISRILGLAASLVNKIQILGNIDKDLRISLIEWNMENLHKDLMIKRVDYGITNPGDRDLIVTEILNLMLTSLQRAFEEGDRRFWKGSVQEIQNKIVTEGQKQQGILSRFWGRRQQ